MLLPPYPPRGYPDEGWPLPEGVRLIENVPVTEHDGVPLHADVLEPPAPNGATIVWVHGGGWRWCDRRTAFERLFRFTERGWTGVTLDYRLTDVARFPAPVRDVQAGLRWVAEEVGRRGLDPDRVVGFGGSAGAHLLLLSVLGAQDAEIGDPAGETLAALIAAFPPTDILTLDDFTDGIVPQFEHHSADSCEGRLLGDAPAAVRELARQASPLAHVRPTKPIRLLHGTDDAVVPLDQSERLAAALQDVGSPVELRTYPGGHGARGWPDGWLRDAIRWAERMVGRRPVTGSTDL